MTETMRWYNPARRVVEEVPAPMSDAQAIELLSGHPGSDEVIEEYRGWRATESGIVGGLGPQGRGVLHGAPEGAAPKLADSEYRGSALGRRVLRASYEHQSGAGDIRRGTPAPKLVKCPYLRQPRLKSCSGMATNW